MDEHEISVPDVLGRFSAMRGAGEAAGGLVRLEVDGTGDLTDLVIEPAAMRLSADELADALWAAFKTARAGLRESMQELPAVPAEPEGMRETIAQLGHATGRLDEMASLARELSAKLDRLA